MCLPDFSTLSHDAFRLASSQCGLRGHHFAGKGGTFEEEIRTLFDNNRIQSTGLRRGTDDDELEIDCVALWDDALFVAECKN